MLGVDCVCECHQHNGVNGYLHDTQNLNKCDIDEQSAECVGSYQKVPMLVFHRSGAN